MIKRKLQKLISDRLHDFPAIALLGPRQVGKTTLAKNLSRQYFDLELEEEKLRLDIQWIELIQGKDIIVLDEAQNFPEIFPRVRSAIDQDRKRMGRFLILGSVSPGLMKEVSEFLTGRIALCELSPFSVLELKPQQDEDLWLKGGYPDGGILKDKNFPVWQKNYLDLLAMRDLPTWGLPARPQVTTRFFRMLAASHGFIWNASQIGKSLGLTYHTINTYLDFLEQAYLIRKLPPYFVNIKKRLVKSPKIYFRDSGLLHSLMNTGTRDELLTQPWVGTSWEGWVIEQILIFLNMNNINFDGPYYFRTSDGNEIDLILVINRNIFTFEIKLSSAPAREDMERLKKAAGLVGDCQKIIISRVIHPTESTGFLSTNLRGFLQYLQKTVRTPSG
jgi:predicted AAA+ superfamily ATPase